MKAILQKFRKLVKIGLVHILGSYSLNKVFSFLSNVLIVRFLTKEDYGYFGSAYNVYLIFIMITGLGMLNAELLYCSEERTQEEKQAIYRYTFMCGLIVDCVLCIIMFLYGLCGEIRLEESRRYVLYLSLLPVIDYVMQYIFVYVRTQGKNKKFAYLSTVNSIMLLVLCGLGAYCGGVVGTILGRYVAYIITIFLGILQGKEKDRHIYSKEKIEKNIRKSIWTYSIKSGLSSAINQCVYLLDIAIISYVISEPTIVASYKVATIIPENMHFIPQAVIITLIPYYARNVNNREWIKSTTKKLFISMAFVNLCITVFLVLGAPIIIKILWGGRLYG